MGLIQAALVAASSTLSDQWKEYFYCDAIPSDVLMVKGQKRVSKKSSNKGNDNIISNGSVICVADGQCMIIVDQGKVAEVCAETGEFVYDSSTEPSIFTGGLKKGIVDSFKTFGRRFTFGGDTAKDQRVYFINTKEILDNKFGTATPIPFRIVDKRLNFDYDCSLRCNGVYSYRITDPVIFYTKLAGNVSKEYTRDLLDTQLKSEFISALQPSIGKLSEMEIRPSGLPAHVGELAEYMNATLTKEWSEGRGIEIGKIAINSITIPEEDQKVLQKLQSSVPLTNAAMMAATLGQAQANAMEAAASNTAGAMTGFMGMGMAMNQAGGTNIESMLAMGQQQNAAAAQAAAQTTVAQPQANGWKCSCGAVNSGKFCTECGAPQPAAGWTCSCGAVNQGKFCPECGAKKPADAPLYKCDKCGWVPEDPKNPPKFCPECGDPFDENDVQ